MAVTLKQLADELGLDHSTVAYALSGKGTIRASTRHRVRQAAERLGYVPNGLARRMRARRTHVIGLVVPDVVLIYNELIQQIFRAATARHYEIQIALTEFKDDREDRAIRSLLEARVDGLIIKSKYASLDAVPEGHALRRLAEQNVPTVVYGHPIPGTPFSAYAHPTDAMAEALTDHLLELGHRHFAWLFPLAPPLVQLHQLRLEGTRRRFAARGLNDVATLDVLTLRPEELLPVGPDDGRPVPAGLLYGNYINQGLPRVGVLLGRTLMRRAMTELNPRPTALMFTNEMGAIGGILEAQAMGLRVPEDVAVAASSRTVATDLAPMTLTTADITPVDAAARMLDLLLELIERRPDKPRVVTSEPVLEIGRSTLPGPSGRCS